MEISQIEFEKEIDTEAAASYLEAIARNLRAGRFSFEAEGEKLQFDVTGPIEFELEADYNPEKMKYSVKVELDWRAPGAENAPKNRERRPQADNR